MSQDRVDRREFLQTAAAGAVVPLAVSQAVSQDQASRLAVLGGKPVRSTAFPSWPIVKGNDRDAWLKVLEEGRWCRLDGQYANSFERAYALRTGTRHCVATANGTSALLTCMNALGVGPGDEVIVPPYTFVATINVVLLQHALPVFVDTDRETMQIDARKIESAITPQTRCLLPAHIGGNAVDLDVILAVGKKRNLPVIEDACQAHLGEWRGRKLGSLGRAGCFSFQASKNLNSGEGGAIIGDDDDFMERCYAFHNNGRRRKGGYQTGPAQGGANLRMTEFQAALLLQQMTRLDEQMRLRDENGAYLSKMLAEIPGIQPAKMYPGCTRNAYHLYMFRYDPEAFGGAPRAKFLKALRAEGVPASGGYSPLNKEPFLRELLQSRSFKSVFGEERLKAYWERNQTPENDRLCEEAVWLGQTVLLAQRSDMEQIAAAVRKVHAHAGELARV